MVCSIAGCSRSNSRFRPLAWLALLALASCQGTAGSIRDGVYSAPDGILSLPVPALAFGTVVEDGYGESPFGGRAGWVSFHDALGDVRSLNYEELVEEAPPPSSEDMRQVFQDRWLPQFLANAPGTELLYESPMTVDGSNCWFAVVLIPEGAPLIVMNEQYPDGKRADSTRAVLLAAHGNWFLTLTYGWSDLEEERSGGPSLDADRAEALKESVASFRASIRFH